MKYEPGTLYSNSAKPVVATDRVNAFGDTIFLNEGSGGECVVIDGQLYAASMADLVHSERIKSRAVATFRLADQLVTLLESHLKGAKTGGGAAVHPVDAVDAGHGAPTREQVVVAAQIMRRHLSAVHG